MNRVHTLSKETAEKIASGEVVERPLSVVKELVENSLDAMADVITVEIEKGGKEYIRVCDNGSGIDKADIKLCFERFATSKIESFDDLSKIKTLGFRGVALSSIAAVSKIELVSKTKEERAGGRAYAEGGKILSFGDAASEEGTTVTVRDLFYNIPKRKSFLKSDNIEASLITDYVSKMALSFPFTRFRMISNGNILFFTSGKGDMKSALAAIYGSEAARGLLPVKGEKGSLKIMGYVSPPSQSSKTKTRRVFFVNGRLTESKIFEKAVEEAYADKLFEGFRPNAFLSLEILPGLADVNILPDKTAVRFYDDAEVKDFVKDIVRSALRTPEAAPGVLLSKAASAADEAREAFDKNEFFKDLRRERGFEDTGKGSAFSEEFSKRKDFFFQDSNESYESYESPKEFFEKNIQEEIEAYGEKAEKRAFNIASLQIMGSLFSTYIVCRDESSLYIFDQHAAHERVMYEKFLKAEKEKEPALQEVMSFSEIRVAPASADLAKDALIFLKSIGFVLEEFGPNAFVLRECPAFLGLLEAEDFAKEVLENFSCEKAFDALGKERIIMRACKAAVKGNDRLSSEEEKELLSDLEKTENPYSCPHGRPTFLRITQRELEHMFKRK